jgi:O-antigen/teichoic acid export membrane protein
LSNARAHYQQKLASLSGLSDALLQQDRRFSQIRVAVFMVAAGLLFVGYAMSPQRAPWTIMGWLGMIVFLAVITWHEYIRLRLWEKRKAERVIQTTSGQTRSAMGPTSCCEERSG